MKNKLIITLFLLFLIVSAGRIHAQDVITVEGSVTSLETGYPIPGHAVYIETLDSLVNHVVYTNQNGYYVDSLDASVSDVIFVYTYDCRQQIHQKNIQNPAGINYVDFEICSIGCDVTADFEYIIDNENPFLVYFTNRTSGANYYHWDFGDGSVSGEVNPQHQFPQTGLYQVLLVAIDTTDDCTDSIIRPVYISDSLPQECNADFTFELDTLSSQKNRFFFTNNSEGSPDYYYWDFGDGTSSTEENPVHVFADSGTYTVCLTIVKESYGLCIDTLCREIQTPDYYQFGGQVFAGNVPINIEPDDSANYATAYLYRKKDNIWYEVDKREFWKLGYYWFVDKLEGDYLIKVELGPGSELYNQYAPAYYPDAVFWNKAADFDLNTNIYDANINLVPVSVSGVGIGSISGKVYLKDSCRNFDVRHVEILLLGSDKRLLKYTYTDSEGNYLIDNLPEGDYKLMAESAGWYSDEVVFSLNSQGMILDSLNIGVSCSNPDGIFEWKKQDNSTLIKAFPTPADNLLTIETDVTESMRITFSILAVTGKTEIVHTTMLKKGRNLFNINTSELSSGIYILRAVSDDQTSLQNIKIIVKH